MVSGAEGRKPRRFRLPSPPVELRPPPRRLRPLLDMLWIASLALAIFSQAGAAWRAYVHYTITQPAFASMGLAVRNAETDHWRLTPITPEAREAGMRNRAVLFHVNGTPVSQRMPPERVAALARGLDGETVTLGVVRPKARSAQGRVPIEARLVRSTDQRVKSYAAERRAARIVTIAVGLLIALVLIAAAVALRLRRLGGPLANLLSFALLLLATQGTWRIWHWLGLDWAPDVLSIAGFSLLLAAIPALPSGRYVPSWSRWSMVVGPLALLLFMFLGSLPLPAAVIEAVGNVSPDRVMAGIVPILLLLTVGIRLRSTPAGMERQQLKWMAVAAAVGLLAYGAGEVLGQAVDGEVFGAGEALRQAVGGEAADQGETFLFTMSFALTRGAFVIGLLACVFAYRLNDADAIIGRSAGYGAIATIVAVVWVGSSSWVEGRVRATAGDSPALAAGITSLIALAVFAPARKRLLAWVEARFQPGLVSLRSLTERISRWQHDDDPPLFAERVLRVIARAVDATSAALVRSGSGEPEILALYKADPAIVRKRLASDLPRKRKKDDFPLVIDLGDDNTPLTLLLGPRGDGAYYGRDERAAIASIGNPLTDALRSSSLRAVRNAALAGVLDEIRSRLPEKDSPKTRKRRAASPNR